MPPRKQHYLYSTWKGMRSRCTNSNVNSYPNYGGRGIAVCPEWDDFWQFVEDMGERPEGYTLDRIDNDKGYSKDNCRWASRKQQIENSRGNPLPSSGYRGVRKNTTHGWEYFIADYYIGWAKTADHAYVLRQQAICELEEAA